jgi:hypothetical protein
MNEIENGTEKHFKILIAATFTTFKPGTGKTRAKKNPSF